MSSASTNAVFFPGVAISPDVTFNLPVATITTPRIAAVVLAAGASSRFGEDNKLASDLGGRSLLARVVDAALASRLSSVTVVVSPASQFLLEEFAGAGITVVVNDNIAAGMSRSLALGIQSLPDTVDGAIILLADMPFVSAGIIDALVAGFSGDQSGDIVVPVSGGRRGNPVLWSASYFEEIKGLSGDRGARALLSVHAQRICELVIDDEAIFIDIDTREVLGVVREGAGPGPGA
jgi:molybdenum cofactor cytidylyltransferase